MNRERESELGVNVFVWVFDNEERRRGWCSQFILLPIPFEILNFE